MDTLLTVRSVACVTEELDLVAFILDSIAEAISYPLLRSPPPGSERIKSPAGGTALFAPDSRVMQGTHRGDTPLPAMPSGLLLR